MGHIVGQEEWGVVDLDTRKGHVFVRSDWNYIWLVEDDQPPWTAQERIAYHEAVDHWVWARWSHRAKIKVNTGPPTGPPRPGDLDRMSKAEDFRQRCNNITLSLTFDVRRVEGNGHWTVTVKKVHPDPKSIGQPGFQRAYVDFDKKSILLHSTDASLRRARREDDPVRRPGFSVLAHEFGHALLLDDEYEKDNAAYDDWRSIMNVGRELRERHLRTVCAALKKMVPGCSFAPFVLAPR
jgi:hypothetical protein